MPSEIAKRCATSRKPGTWVTADDIDAAFLERSRPLVEAVLAYEKQRKLHPYTNYGAESNLRQIMFSEAHKLKGDSCEE